jgi:HK97 family phage major capsid protein
MPAERLHDLRRRRAELVAKMQAIVKQEDELPEGESLPDETASQFEELKVQLAELDGRIQRIEAALAAAAASTSEEGDEGDDDDGERGGRSLNRGGFRARTLPAQARKQAKKGPGLQAARFCYGLIYARYHNLPLAKAAEFIENRFGDGDVAKALNSSVTGEGGALIPQDFLADLIELLRANTVVRASDPMTVGMPMGNLTIPRLAGGASAAYQGELDDIQISQERFDDVNFVAKKLTSMVPVSNDLIRRAPIGVEEIVRDDLVQTMARREDLAFLRGDGTAKDPIGFRTLCLPANVIPVAAMADPTQPGEALTAILAAASAALLALRNGMSRMIRPTWIMAPTTARFIATARDQIGGFYFKDELAAGMFEGYPLRQTQQIPTNLGAGHGSEIYFADFADVVIADTYNVIVDASDVASYNDGTSMISAFQRDQSLFRVIGEHDFNMRHLQSLVVLQTIDWTFPGVPGLPGAPWSTQALNPTWSQAPAIRPATATGANPPPTLTNPA